MRAHIFHLRLPTGPVVRGIRVLAEGREQAAARVFRMYPGSTECVEAGAAAVHTNGASTPAFLMEMKRSAARPPEFQRTEMPEDKTGVRFRLR